MFPEGTLEWNRISMRLPKKNFSITYDIGIPPLDVGAVVLFVDDICICSKSKNSYINTAQIVSKKLEVTIRFGHFLERQNDPWRPTIVQW